MVNLANDYAFKTISGVDLKQIFDGLDSDPVKIGFMLESMSREYSWDNLMRALVELHFTPVDARQEHSSIRLNLSIEGGVTTLQVLP